MKKIAALAFAAFIAIAFTACKEETAGEKLDNAIEEGKDKAADAQKDAAKAVENLGK